MPADTLFPAGKEMSRGIGKLQQQILAALEPDNLFSVSEAVERIYGLRATASEYESLRRALHGLEKRELIDNTWWYRFFGSAPPRYGLPATIAKRQQSFELVMSRREERLSVAPAALQHIDPAISVALAAEPTLKQASP